jgi:hypothetical protein
VKTRIAPPHREARLAGFRDGLAKQRRRAGEWPQGVYGHADYELGYADGETEDGHSVSPDCWCGPYQDKGEPAVWIHRRKMK